MYSSQEGKIQSASSCQQTSSIGRNFMVKLGCPLFLTIERNSENSVFRKKKKKNLLNRHDNSSKAYKQSFAKNKIETYVPFYILSKINRK